MTIENALVLGILGAAVVLFASEKLRVDVVALLVLVALILTGLVTTEEAFSGFASPAVVTVWSVFIVSGALFRTGVADVLARYMLRLAGHSPVRLTITIMLTVGVMSAFMNNIGAVAILLPAVVSVAREAKIAPSKLLIPLSFASLMGGNMTIIGTPPNILAASILDTYEGIPSFTFFDFAPMGVIVLTSGILYMVLVGRHLLPARDPSDDLSKAYQITEYLTEVEVGADSPLVGESIASTQLGERYDVSVINVYSDHRQTVTPNPERVLQAGDVLLIEGSPTNILALNAAQELSTVPEWSAEQAEEELTAGDTQLVEITLAPGADLRGKTLQQIDFRPLYELSVLAIRHHGRSLVSRLADVPLEFGDSLLVQGAPDKVNLLRRDPNFLVLDTPPLEMRRINKAPIAVAILLGTLVVVSLGLLHVSTAMLVGALAMVLTGTLNMDEAYQSIEWKSVFLIAGMLPMGAAMETTGTAAWLADQIVSVIGGWGPLAVLLGIFVMTALLTEVISNAAATVLAVPIAIDSALALGADPRSFVMAVILAAATSFLMPIGHQVNVLVFGPGGYRFLDYTRVGVFLNLIMLIVVAIFLPMIWPLFP